MKKSEAPRIFAKFRSKRQALDLEEFKTEISSEWQKLLDNNGTNTDKLALRFEAKTILVKRGFSYTQAAEILHAAIEMKFPTEDASPQPDGETAEPAAMAGTESKV